MHFLFDVLTSRSIINRVLSGWSQLLTAAGQGLNAYLSFVPFPDDMGSHLKIPNTGISITFFLQELFRICKQKLQKCLVECGIDKFVCIIHTAGRMCSCDNAAFGTLKRAI
jgi:hypothetical protein